MNRVAVLAAILLASCSSDPVEGPDVDSADVSTKADASAPDAGAGDAEVAGPDMELTGQDQGSPQDLGFDGGNGLLPGWHDRASLPGAQQEVAVVALDGLVWVMGGFSETAQQLATVVVYDPATDSWSSRADFPTRANHMNATVHDGKIWVTGFLHMGFQPDGRTFVYDPGTDVWSPGPDLPAGRGRGASAVGVIDGEIYVAGGGGQGGSVAQFDVLDPVTETWTPLPDVPRNVDHAGFGVIDGTFVLASGRAGTIPSFVDGVHLFDPAVGQWVDAAPIPTARGGVASAVHGGKLYVFGGEGHPTNPSGVFDEVEVYELSSDTWERLDPMTMPRHGFAGATIGDIIYLPGGAPTEFLDAADTHQIYVP